MSEEDRNSLIPYNHSYGCVPRDEDDKVDLIKVCKAVLGITDGEEIHCRCACRSGSPDACPICTNMESGEKFVEQEHICFDCKGSGLDKNHQWPDGSFASCETCEGYGTLSEA